MTTDLSHEIQIKKFTISLTALVAAILTLAACGKERTSSGTFQKPTEECASDVVPERYIVRYVDGSIKTARAHTLEAFFKDHVEPELDSILFTEPDYYVRTDSTVTAMAGSADNWAAARVGADALWSSPGAIRGNGVTVAIVDSGMDTTHTQLRTQLAANPGEQGLDASGHDKATNGIDDDGNGLVDDAYGWDFIKNAPLTRDYQLHGTHVAGIVAAAHSDTVAGVHSYVQGIAPGAKILPLAFLNEKGSGMMSDGVRAIQYAVQRGAQVINASWGGAYCSRSLKETVDSLAGSHVIFVSAAGNGDGNGGVNIDRYREYPASLNGPSQFTVGATGAHDYVTTFSNYGEVGVHIFAPGENIVSTVPGGMMSLDGTSMATPVVSGAIALLLSAEPAASADQLRKALYNAAYKQSYYLSASHGRLDLRTALSELRNLMGH